MENDRKPREKTHASLFVYQAIRAGYQLEAHSEPLVIHVSPQNYT
jgi:hypothetical protein